MTSINPLAADDVRKLCSSQVILSLAGCLKELIENAVDAGSKSIEIRLDEYGSDLVEVCDDGLGISEHDFDTVAKPHATSKLRSFENMSELESYGFRGEALSSLAAVSELEIITRTSSMPCAYILKFDEGGALCSKIPCSRQPGTTVRARTLFESLSVRRKEFIRNARREYNKAITTITGFALNSHIRFSCAASQNGKKTTVLRSLGSSIRDNVSSIWGPSQLKSLIDLAQCPPTEDVLQEFGLDAKAVPSDSFSLEGLVSSCEQGQGRAVGDRQFIYINSRSVDYPKISKITNETYKLFNRPQYPVLILNIKLALCETDVNLSPDKRKILVKDEKALLAVLKSSLLNTFATSSRQIKSIGDTSAKHLSQSQRHQYQANPATTCDLEPNSSQSRLSQFLCKPYSKHGTGLATTSVPAVASCSLSAVTNSRKRQTGHTTPVKAKQMRPSGSPVDNVGSVEGSNIPLSTTGSCDVSDRSLDRSHPFRLLSDNHASVVQGTNRVPTKESVAARTVVFNDENENDHLSDVTDFAMLRGAKLSHRQRRHSSDDAIIHDRRRDARMQECLSDCDSPRRQPGSPCMELNPLDFANRARKCNKRGDKEKIPAEPKPRSRPSLQMPGSAFGLDMVGTITGHEDIDQRTEFVEMKTKRGNTFRRSCRKIDFSLDAIAVALKSRHERVWHDSLSSAEGEPTFRAEIRPSQNDAAISELRQNFTTDMFGEMEIIGQFNLGFIIARHGRELFIVDQHASDEKNTFEQLQSNVQIQSQRLIQHRNLGLISTQEQVVMDNIDIFRANGFDFIVNPEADSGQRVLLSAVPVSSRWVFDKEDVEELIGMLADFPGVMYRPSRLRDMFASRACRSSIMIGTALSHPKMKQIVENLGKLEQPWNCPHGRPTLRHLFSLSYVSEKYDSRPPPGFLTMKK